MFSGLVTNEWNDFRSAEDNAFLERGGNKRDPGVFSKLVNTQNTKPNEELVKDYFDGNGDVIIFCKYYSHMSYKMKLAMDTKTELVVESIKNV